MLHDSILETIAGVGADGYSGDGGPAAEAALDYPGGICFDAGGNLYIADASNNRIRKIDREGIITTTAGIGLSGFLGDGGPATEARLDDPTDVAADRFGNIYIADSGNQRVRKIDRQGVITTVAGCGYCREWVDDGYSGGGGWEENACSDGDGGPAVDAHLYDVDGVEADEYGNLWIATGSGNRIRKVSPDGSISTAAGDGEYGSDGDGGQEIDAHFNGPADVALDAQGNLYVAERSGHRIRKIDASGKISTVAGKGSSGFSGDGGAAVSARLKYPVRILAGPEDTLYISDYGNKRIRAVDGNGVYGDDGDGQPATRGRIANPDGLALDHFQHVQLCPGEQPHCEPGRVGVGPGRLFVLFQQIRIFYQKTASSSKNTPTTPTAHGSMSETPCAASSGTFLFRGRPPARRRDRDL